MSDQWPPKADRVVPTHVVNLDLPPVQRWNEVATAYKSEVRHRRECSEDHLMMMMIRSLIW